MGQAIALIVIYLMWVWILMPKSMGYYDKLFYWCFSLLYPVLGIIFWYIFFYPGIRRWK